MWRIGAVLTALIPGALVALSAQPPPPPFLQNAALTLAAADIAQIGATLREDCRYLWVPPTVPASELDTLWRVLSGQCNGMSREPDLVPLAIVPGSGGRLFRLSLRDYRWQKRVWEKFGTVDPYFYTTVDEYWEAGVDSKTGERWAAGNYPTVAVAPWAADTPAAANAAKMLLSLVQPAKGTVRVPIASVTLFAFTTFVSTNGSPQYNEFLEVKTERDFFRLIGVREDEDEAFEAAMLSVVAESGITKEPRAIEMREKIGGNLFRTHDFVKAVGKSNPFQNVGRDGKKLRVKADAHESYGHLANGLWAVDLANGDGVVQNVAPQGVTTGDTTTTDPRNHDVEIPLSCHRCHRQAGVQPLDDWFRNLQRPPPVPPLALQVGNKADPGDLEPAVDEALRLRRQYGPKLEPSLERGRQRFTEALLTVTGLKPEAWADGYGKVWSLLAEPRIDSAWAARDLGVSETVFVGAIERELKGKGGVDVLLSGFLKPKKEQKMLQIRQWIELVPQAQKTLRGLGDVKKVKVP